MIDKNSKYVVELNCTYCDKKYYKYLYKIKMNKNNFCSRKCYSDWSWGENSHSWHGGKLKVHCAQCGKECYRNPGAIKKFKNHFCSRDCHKKWVGNNKGKNHPCSTLVDIKCAWCGKEFSQEPNRIKKAKNNFCSVKCRGEWSSVDQYGENNTNWKGGLTYETYCRIWKDNEFKNYIFERDDYKCQNPECFGISDNLCRHHIDYDKKNCGPNNIILLCNSCNIRANVDREWHEAFYNEIMRRKTECVTR